MTQHTTTQLYRHANCNNLDTKSQLKKKMNELLTWLGKCLGRMCISILSSLEVHCHSYNYTVENIFTSYFFKHACLCLVYITLAPEVQFVLLQHHHHIRFPSVHSQSVYFQRYQEYQWFSLFLQGLNKHHIGCGYHESPTNFINSVICLWQCRNRPFSWLTTKELK